jgi:hypothetical protein
MSQSRSVCGAAIAGDMRAVDPGKPPSREFLTLFSGPKKTFDFSVQQSRRQSA